MNYQYYKNMLKSKLFACALLLGLTAVALQAQPYTIGLMSSGGGNIIDVVGTTNITSVTVPALYVPSIEIQAVPSSGKVFSHWEYVSPADKDVININPDTYSDVVILALMNTDSSSRAVRAVFVNEPVNVTVTSLASGIEVGNPAPGHGVNPIPTGTKLTARVTSPYAGAAGIRYKCIGFAGTGDFPSTGSGTNATATIMQDSTITWNWETEYLLTLTTSGGGTSTIDQSPHGETWFKSGETVSLTAQPAEGYNFLRWENPGGPADGITTETVSVPMNRAEKITAIFKSYSKLSLEVISKDENNSHVAGFSYVGQNTRFHIYNTLIDIGIAPTVLSSGGKVREHCMGYTSTGGDVLPPTLANTEISGIAPFLLTANTTITLDWTREYKIQLGVAGKTDTNGYDVSYFDYSPKRAHTQPPWFRAGDTVTISAASLTADEIFIQWDSAPFGIDPYSPTNTFVVTGAADIKARFASLDLDSDFDGIPDTWETKYGLNPNYAGDAHEDPDNDGLTNLEEYMISLELLEAGIGAEISPINADSDGDGMIDGYEYHHIVIPGSGTPVGQSRNALAVVSPEGDNGPLGNPDEDFHWDTNNGYEDKTRGLLNIEEYIGPDNIPPYIIREYSWGSSFTLRKAEENPLDSGDTSWSDTTDSDEDGFDDGFEYSWDQWQGGHGGESARDPMNHVIPDRFGVSALPVSVVNADVNGDGIEDLITVCYEQELVSVLIGDGESGFAAPVTYQLGLGINPMSLVADDFNGDGLVDVITANEDGSYSVLFGTGDVADLFPVVDNYPLGGSFIRVESVDLDGVDGPDLVFADLNNAVYVALNDGTGDFSNSNLIPLSDVPGDIKLAPMYNDKTSTINDLVVALTNDTLKVFANDGSGGFTSTTTINLPAGAEPGACDVADFNNNGYNDIAVACTGDNHVRVYINYNGSGVFNMSANFLVQDSAGLVDLVAADFTTYGNTDPLVIKNVDFAVVAQDLSSVFLYSGNGLGTFGHSGTLATGAGPVAALFVELRTNDPAFLDLIVLEKNTDSVVEFLNNGSGVFSGYSQFDVSDRIVDRRFNPAVKHIQEDTFGRPDYDLVYHIESGRAVAWFTDILEYSVWKDGGQVVGSYFIPQIIGGSEENRRSSHPFYWDADGDGMPDGWEIAYGYDPWSVATYGGINDALANPDGDWYAVDGDLKHKEVYDAHGFHPATGYGYIGTWNDPGPHTAEYVNYQEMLGASKRPAIMPHDPNDGGTSPISHDTDGDGIWDGWELYVGLDPNEPRDAGEDIDTLNQYPWAPDDGDGLTNFEEFQSLATSTNDVSLLTPVPGWFNKTLPTDPHDYDTDGDELIDGAERTYFNFSDSFNGGGLCPTSVDTDGDRLPDAWEAYFAGFGDTNGWSGGMNGTAHDAYLDYDNDGLLNYQEYLTGANYGWRYDRYIPNMGAGAYDPYDFFADKTLEGGFGRLPKEWDPSYFLDPPDNRVNLRFMLGSVTIVNGSPTLYFPTSNPADADSDFDGMSDYWEVFHGLNPLYGNEDLVGASEVDELAIPYEFWHSARDYNRTPWISGFPNFDVDQDGLDNYEEVPFDNAIPYHHTDPSPLWMTDISADLSYANLYYWTGTFAANAEWYWGDVEYGGLISLADYGLRILPANLSNSDNGVIEFAYAAPRYAYSFEINEGYDTDNDGISDFDELNDTVVSPGISDPLDSMSPNINRVLYLNGEAYTETPMPYGWEYPDYRTYTIEAWVKPEVLPTAKKQIVMQRGGYLSNADQFNPAILGWRRNFELGLTRDGKPYVLFDTPVGKTIEAVANFAVEAGEWYHISASYEGDYDSSNQFIGKLNLYLDGVLIKRLPVSTMPANSYQGASVQMLGSMTFVVGNGYHEADPNKYFFKGWVDNVRAWGAYQSQDTIQANMRTTFNRVQANNFATNETTRLLYCFSFNDLPDPDIDNITPDGFNALVGYPVNYTAIPFWRAMADRSKIYNDYRYLPWIDNQSMHYARPIASDMVLSNNVYGIHTTPPVNYPNTSDPYGFKYLTGSILENTQDPALGKSLWPSYESIIHPDLLANTPVFADMLPMLYARTTESVEMWDEIPARAIDSDGDGMPDLWEIAMGLDPYNAIGINGAYGDYDRDGLSNYHEYQAGTSPLEYASTTNNIPDFFGWGNNLTGALNHDYRTFGELLTDHDQMEDDWERLNGLSPFLFDAFDDNDGDGWCNYNEFRAGTFPNTSSSIPLPEMNFKVYYDGLDGRVPFDLTSQMKIWFYTDPASDPDCMMRFDIEATGATPATAAGNTGVLMTPVVPSSVSVNGGVLRDSTADGRLLDAAGVQHGTVNYYSGYYSISTGYSPVITYSYGGVYGFPVYGVVSNIFVGSGTTHDGLNSVFVFADIDGDDSWDPTIEPAGVADNGDTMLNGNSPDLFDVTLKDYAPGFGRFTWSLSNAAIGFRLNVAKGAYQLFTTELSHHKYFFMENDFMEIYGNALPEGTITWSVDMKVQDGSYSNNYASGSFDIDYPSVLEVPTIISPNTSVKCTTYREKFIWENADKEAPFYDLQIATDVDFNNIVLSKTGYVAIDVLGLSQVILPKIGSGLVWEQRTYYWRVRNRTSNAVGVWSAVEPFRVDYESDKLYTHSISGTAYYSGKAKTGKIVVEAYNNPSFSGSPKSVDVIANNPQPELWPLNPYEYELNGLTEGTYYVRAFLDQNNNYLKDDFETYGYVTDGKDVYVVNPIVVSTLLGDAEHQNLFMIVADTDNDMLADDWEWSYFGSLDVAGAGEVRGFTDFDGNGVNDFEAYAWTALNMSPFDGEIAGADNIPYALKANFGLGVTDDVEFSLKGIDFDKYGNLNISWSGFGGTQSITLSSDNGSKALSVTAGGSTVQYTLQYSSDMKNWVDVQTGGTSQYNESSDMFMYTGQTPNVSAVGNNEPIFFRFKVTW